MCASVPPTVPRLINILAASIHNLPFHENPYFVGRHGELEALEQKLFGQPRHPCVAIVGLGGIGKTQVALSFAHWVRRSRPEFSLFWVSAVSTGTIEKSFEDIGDMLGLIVRPEDRKSARTLVCRRLSSPAAGSWLLVVDNADDPELVQGQREANTLLQDLPRSEHGLTVFTTRNHDVAQSVAGVDTIIVEKPSESEARNMLSQAINDKTCLEDETAILELLAELDNLPLAITQAAAYVNVNRISISDYLDIIRSTERDLVEAMSVGIRDNTAV